MDYPQINRENYDFLNDTEVCNIGFKEGVIEERPYRLEVWASNGITNATIFISTIDMENITEKSLKKMLEKNKLIEIINDDILIAEVTDIDENNFYSINIPLESNYEVINKLLVKVDDFDI